MGAAPFTHGTSVQNVPRSVANNTAVERVETRLDGWAALELATGGADMAQPSTPARAQFTTRWLRIPATCASQALIFNLETSVIGSLRVALLEPKVHHQSPTGKQVQGFGLNDSDPISGNFLRRRASWGGDVVLNVTGRAVQLQIELRGPVRLFSFGFECLKSNRVAAKNDDSTQDRIRASGHVASTQSQEPSAPTVATLPLAAVLPNSAAVLAAGRLALQVLATVHGVGQSFNCSEGIDGNGHWTDSISFLLGCVDMAHTHRLRAQTQDPPSRIYQSKFPRYKHDPRTTPWRRRAGGWAARRGSAVVGSSRGGECSCRDCSPRAEFASFLRAGVGRWRHCGAWLASVGVVVKERSPRRERTAAHRFEAQAQPPFVAGAAERRQCCGAATSVICADESCGVLRPDSLARDLDATERLLSPPSTLTHRFWAIVRAHLFHLFHLFRH
eukprot:SAG11_NODE_2783_length_2977_cov_1.840862_2_plen_445_part_00